MDIINEIIRFIGEAGSDTSDTISTLTRFGKLETVKIELYFNFWRSQILKAISNNKLLSNGWAFSTLSGLASYETYIHTDKDIRSLYFNRSGEIGITIDAIADNLKMGSIGGVIFYGYGNLMRESYFIEYLLNSRLLTKQRIYLIDCSLYYHIFAKSSINPLRSLVKNRQLKLLLLDYLDDPTVRDTLIYIRNDLNPTRSVLHLFLGNTFCNVDSNSLKNLLDTMVRPGDFVIGEYAIYPKGYFADSLPDYASEMARIATAELFAISPESVNTTNITHGDKSKLTEIRFKTQDDKEARMFRSMLRREFNYTELIRGKYELITSKSVLPSKIRMDSFKRLVT